MAKPVDFQTAFKYPFNRAKGMWNILWVFLPFFGWFALWGFQVRIVNEFLQGKFKKLPKFSFKSDMKLGFWMFLKALPFWFAFIVIVVLGMAIDPTLGAALEIFLGLIVVPVLTIHFFKKQTVDSYFEIRKVQYVFDNFADYIVAILKAIGLAVVFFVMWIVLVGIPAGAFTKNLFVADFYRRRVK